MAWSQIPNHVYQYLRQHRKLLWQGSTLFGAKVGVIGLGVLIKAIQTRALSPELYGFYAFFTTLTAFTALFFRFGYFTSLKVLLANNKVKQKEQEFFGLGLIAGLLIGLAYAIFLFLISFGVDPIFDVQLGTTLRYLSPLCMVFPMHHLLQDLTIGSNQVSKMAAYDVSAKGLFLLPLASLFWWDCVTLTNLLWLNVSTALLAMGVVFWLLKPRFTRLSRRLNELRFKQRNYGIHYYTGNLANQSTFKLDELLISYYINTTQLGFYSLANFICAPMVFLSQAFTNALFKEFAHRDYIPYKLFLFNALWLIAALAGLMFLSEWLVKVLLGSGYQSVAHYVKFLAVAHLFQGLYQPFAFLSAKSWGKAVRNVSILESVINLVGSIVLIIMFGIYGALITSIAAKLTHFLGLWYYYRQYRLQVM